jgi:hypothetical protein
MLLPRSYRSRITSFGRTMPQPVLLGALIGAYVTFQISARASSGLKSALGRVQSLLTSWGFATVFVSCVAPPPFLTSPFFIGGGALRYPTGRFVSANLAGRAIRYGLLGFLAATYSRTILRLLRHPRGFEADARLIGIAVAGFAGRSLARSCVAAAVQNPFPAHQGRTR